jgi:hypothetical protein
MDHSINDNANVMRPCHPSFMLGHSLRKGRARFRNHNECKANHDEEE